MNVFAFLIHCLKKGWGNESSLHHFRGFWPVIWHGLRLPVTFGWFYARPTAVSDAALSRRDKKIARLERGASKRRIVLSLAWWLGGATCTIGNAGFAIECDNAKVGTYTWKNFPSAYSDCHYPYGSLIVFPFIMTSNGYVSFTSFSSDGLTPSPSTANSALFMSTYTEIGGYEGTCDTYDYFSTSLGQSLPFSSNTSYCHVTKGDCKYIATQATTGASDTNTFSNVSANYKQVTTGSCAN
ncbi:MAG TPA: hypothetical protein EYP59_03020 [Thiotrichaceae bacterium]|nr:hypothetical protein [Thiotrichaceae bacterium]